MNRRVFLFMFALLAGVLLLARSPVRALEGGDVEPNNTPAQAVPVEFQMSLYGTVSLSDPIDYYRFTGQAGKAIVLTTENGIYHPGDIPTLLDSSLNPIPLIEQVPGSYPAQFWAMLPSSGTYTIGITRGELETWTSSYNFALNRLLDIEPNNVPGEASPLVLGETMWGSLSLGDPVDTFRFTGVAGDTIALLEPYGYGSNSYSTLALFNSSLNPISLQPHSNWATLPANGTYYLKVTGQNLDAVYLRDYSYQFVKLQGDEPNDTFATALPVDAYATVQNTWDYACDVDMYRFEGRAGDVFPVSYPDGPDAPTAAYELYDANGSELEGLNLLPADGVYYLKMLGWQYEGSEGDCFPNGPYEVTIGYPMWVSAAQNGLPTKGSTPISSADIAMRASAAGRWRLVFDASDVGITTNLNAIERLADGSILMSLAASQNVAGLGKVMPQDIIRFIPTSLGDNTAGTFEWYLDGSDVGLTTAGENIDAIYMKPWESDANPLVISVSGKGSAPRHNGGTLQFADEDLLTFVGTSFGQNTAGKWRFNLDGSTVTGMAVEDVSAATMLPLEPSRNSRLFLAFDSAYKIGGLKGTPKDVFEIGSGVLVKSLMTKTIDAMTIGVNVP